MSLPGLISISGLKNLDQNKIQAPSEGGPGPNDTGHHWPPALARSPSPHSLRLAHSCILLCSQLLHEQNPALIDMLKSVRWG